MTVEAQFDRDVPRRCMPDRVGDGFLCDSKQVLFDVRGQLLRRSDGVDSDADVRVLAKIGRHAAEAGDDIVPIEILGMQIPHGPPCLTKVGLNELPRLLHVTVTLTIGVIVLNRR